MKKKTEKEKKKKLNFFARFISKKIKQEYIGILKIMSSPRLVWLFSSNILKRSLVTKSLPQTFGCSFQCRNFSSFSSGLYNSISPLMLSRSEFTSSQSRVTCIGGTRNGLIKERINGYSPGINIGSIKFGVRFDSTKRKRKKMMNKHKYEKRMKTLKSLSSLNIRGGKSRVG